ncbi:MAG: 3-deoxy-manno-octulosonate cytidylyltransferase [Lentisphaerae bacterium]|nr:3-deoxy-manno-octulosonate cytidylyltransferase [Lentisphaerota bacterium]
MKTAAIIPARMGSTRFPGKVLANLGGKPIVQWVWERTKASKADEVIVASDSEEVIRAVQAFGGNAQMTSPNHPSGSDRIWEVASKLDCDIIINVQGDEPFMEPTVIDQLIDIMQETPAPDMATVVVPSTREQIANNPNSPKVVVSADNTALYFSRSPIPFLREGGTDMPLYKHWGIYAYSSAALSKFVSLPESPLEKCEKLEQLRALENGMKIKVIKTNFQSIGIDTPEDLIQAEQHLKNLK